MSRKFEHLKSGSQRLSAAKDVPAIMKGYAPGSELFVFDVTPPRQYVGFEAYKKDWAEFFVAFPGSVD
jgi:ketosteroid isomerase-like protein